MRLLSGLRPALGVALAACGGTVMHESDGGAPDAEAADADVPCIPAVVEVSGTCARKADGTMWCWGENAYGEVGDGTTQDKPAAVQVTAVGTSTVQIAAGWHQACARKTDGTLWCWGAVVGDGTTQHRSSPVQVAAFGVSVADVVIGMFDTCARKTDGTLWCWGANIDGELGDGTRDQRLSPVQVAALGNSVAQVALGVSHTCARKTDGTAWCWGLNNRGQLGDGTLQSRRVPGQVAALGTSVAYISAGSHLTYARKTDGTFWCWGEGSCGDGLERLGSTPVQVPALDASVAELSAAGSLHTCAVKANGTLWCWGENYYGELGDGTWTTGDRLSPVRVSPLGTSVAAVSAGEDNTCAIKTDGSLWCWGKNTRGEVGDGTTAGTPCAEAPDGGTTRSCRLLPVKVVGLCP